MIMETSTGAETAHQLNNDNKPTQSETLSSTVHNITAKFFLNRPPEDLIPARYLEQAECIRKYSDEFLSPLHCYFYPPFLHHHYNEQLNSQN